MKRITLVIATAAGLVSALALLAQHKHAEHAAPQHELNAHTQHGPALPKPVQVAFDGYIKIQTALAQDSLQDSRAEASIFNGRKRHPKRKKVMHSEQTNGRNRVRGVEAGRTAPDSQTPALQPVRFEYGDAAARQVGIAGYFNNWNVSRTQMVRLLRGRWLRVIFLPPGRYKYMFVVDGRCVADPRAIESVPNVYGCVNSVLSVPAGTYARECSSRLPARAKPGGCFLQAHSHHGGNHVAEAAHVAGHARREVGSDAGQRR